MITNKEMLKFCLENASDIEDDFKIDRERIIIPRTSREDNELTLASKSLVNLFTTMATLNREMDYSKDEKIAKKIISLLTETENIHFFPFNFYCQTQGITNKQFQLLSFEKQMHLIKDYIEDRHEMYLEHGYSNTTLQALCDSYAHKRHSDTGTRKIRTQAENHGIKHIDYGFEDYYLNPDKGDEKKFKVILKNNHIDYPYYKKHNSKLPDLFLKIGDNFVIVEHKHMKELGGHQNNVIVDIMDFISEKDANVYYVSYIDGVAFSEYFGLKYDDFKDDKFDNTNSNLMNIFAENERSYIVNSAGFDYLIDELKKGK